MTSVINLFGGPGIGKSTLAAELFVKMKRLGVNCELVREYVKDWAWEGRKIVGFDQFYIYGKQTRKESLLFGKVDWVVTDSPIWLSGYYGAHYENTDVFTEMCRSYYSYCVNHGVNHHNFSLSREKEYSAVGRYQTELEAKRIDTDVIRYLNENDVSVTSVNERDELKADTILRSLGIK